MMKKCKTPNLGTDEAKSMKDLLGDSTGGTMTESRLLVDMTEDEIEVQKKFEFFDKPSQLQEDIIARQKQGNGNYFTASCSSE